MTYLSFKNHDFGTIGSVQNMDYIGQQTTLSIIYIDFPDFPPLESFTNIRGCVDKTLARSTSQCRRTESIVSLERGDCSCAVLQVFSCYRHWMGAYKTTRTISTTSRREPSPRFFFPARQNPNGNSLRSDRHVRGTCTIVFHRQKLGVPV
jgi:hypothetical protein